MDKQPFNSQGVPLQGANSVTGYSGDRKYSFQKHNTVTKKDLSAQIEDNLSRLFECLKLEYGRYSGSLQ